MKRMLFGLSLTIFVGSAHASESIPTLMAKAPDYVATYVVSSSHSLDKEITVTHHAGWLKSNYGDRQIFLDLRNGVSVTVVREGSDIVSYSLDRRHPDLRDGWGRLPTTTERTSETAQIAGEICTWYETKERELNGTSMVLVDASCLADDGLELARRQFHSIGDRTPQLSRSTEIKTIKRKDVDRSEATPPPSLFDLSWIANPQTSSDVAEIRAQLVDYSVEMIGKDEKSSQIVRRSYPWFFSQTKFDGMTYIDIRHDLDGASLEYTQYGVSYEHMTVRRKKNGYTFVRPAMFDFKNATIMYITDNILGERCRWFDMTPRTEDYGFRQCLTIDSIPLITLEFSGWGKGAGKMTATAMKRENQKLETMLPPREILQPAYWGIPDN